MTKVFVYGSLLNGLGNHGLLHGATFLGIAKTPKQFKMLDLGWFPGVIKTEQDADTIIGEVYEVDDETFRKLDRLEGYNNINPNSGLYNRMEIETDFGKAFIYIYNNHYGRSGNFVDNGDWRSYYYNKTSIK